MKEVDQYSTNSDCVIMLIGNKVDLKVCAAGGGGHGGHGKESMQLRLHFLSGRKNWFTNVDQRRLHVSFTDRNKRPVIEKRDV